MRNGTRSKALVGGVEAAVVVSRRGRQVALFIAHVTSIAADADERETHQDGDRNQYGWQ